MLTISKNYQDSYLVATIKSHENEMEMENQLSEQNKHI